MRNWIPKVATICVVMLLGACASSDAKKQRPLYQRLGGKGALVAVVDDFTARVMADARISHHFATGNLGRFKSQLVDQLCEATAGPCKYKGQDMRAAHLGRGITGADFDALLENLVGSLDRFRVPEREKKEEADLVLQSHISQKEQPVSQSKNQFYLLQCQNQSGAY